MSRRPHAGGRVRRHAGGRPPRDVRRPASGPPERPQINRPAADAPGLVGPPPTSEPVHERPTGNGTVDEPLVEQAPPDGSTQRAGPGAPVRGNGHPAAGAPAVTRSPGGPPPRAAGVNGFDGACTAPQLRRFIKSRAYVPMHELRRRFGINGGDDDVTPVAFDGTRVYVGLPPREGALLGELLRGGEVGFELSLDPVTPIIVGVYPMRPVPRP